MNVGASEGRQGQKERPKAPRTMGKFGKAGNSQPKAKATHRKDRRGKGQENRDGKKLKNRRNDKEERKLQKNTGKEGGGGNKSGSWKPKHPTKRGKCHVIWTQHRGKRYWEWGEIRKKKLSAKETTMREKGGGAKKPIAFTRRRGEKSKGGFPQKKKPRPPQPGKTGKKGGWGRTYENPRRTEKENKKILEKKTMEIINQTTGGK